MSLMFVTGGSGSGKTRYCQEYVIRESLAHPDRNYIYMVPEQFTMSTQRELVLRHPRRGIMGIEVLSFARLAWRIFEETGADTKDVLSETGKNLILRRVASSCREDLTLLRRRMEMPGYVSRVKSALSEFAQYGIGDAELTRMIGFCEGRPQLQYKLRDLQVLARAFDAFRADRFLTGEELLGMLALLVPESALLARSEIVLDSFSGFTPIQLKVLEAMLPVCPKITVAVTLGAGETADGPIEDHELFAMGRKMIRTLRDLAMETRTGISDPVTLEPDRGRFVPGSRLEHLERNLFRPIYAPWTGEGQARKESGTEPGAGQALQTGTEPGAGQALQTGRAGRAQTAGTPRTGARAGEAWGDISIHVSTNPAREAAFAAEQVRALVDEGGLRCREIAVICGSLPDYESHIRREFAARGIPCFIDRKVPLSANPCLEFIRGAMEAVDRNWSYEAVMRMLRTGFSGEAREEIDLTENYLLACGIRGRKRWHENWERETAFMDAGKAARCEGVRVRLTERMEPFCRAFAPAQGPVSAYVEGIRLFMDSFGLEAALEEKSRALAQAGEAALALQYAQAGSILDGVLREMDQLLGEEVLTRREFAKILDAGFEEARVGIIPPGLDQVSVGDMERTRLENIRALLFLGVNDGWIPPSAQDDSLVSQADREYLAAAGVVLSPDEREKSCMHRFFLYRAMTRPSEQLIVSYSRKGGDGKLMRPSYLIGLLKKMFPGLEETGEPASFLTMEEDGPRLDADRIGTGKEAALALADLLRETARTGASSPALRDLMGEMKEHTDLSGPLSPLSALTYPGGERSLGGEAAADLYGGTLTGGVTRLERFASCAYGHFLVYGLRLRERERYEVTPADLGTVFHAALDDVFAALADRAGKESSGFWFRTDAGEVNRLTDACLDRCMENYGRGVFFDTERSRQETERIRRILRRSVWALLRQIEAGKFVPEGFEQNFSLRIPDASGQGDLMDLHGRIDRIDTYREGDDLWLKVIDYKSGGTTFDMGDLYYGLQLQLPLYMNAACQVQCGLEPDRIVRPGAMFYYHLQDPLTEVDPAQFEAGETDEGSLLRKLRPGGLLCSHPDLVEALDTGLAAKSDVAPLERKKDGTLSARSGAVAAEQMDLVTAFAGRSAADMAERIMAGEIRRYPCRKGTEAACGRCPAAEACPQDPHLPGCRYRSLKKISAEDFWNLVRQEETESTESESTEAENTEAENTEAES